MNRTPDIEIYLRNKKGSEISMFFLSEKLLKINWTIFEDERTRYQQYESEAELVEKALRTILYLGGEFLKLAPTVKDSDIIAISNYYVLGDKTFIVNENNLLRVTINNREKIISEYPCFYSLVEDINNGKEIIMEYLFREAL